MTWHDVNIIWVWTIKGSVQTRLSIPQSNRFIELVDGEDIKNIPVFEQIYHKEKIIPPKKIDWVIYIVPSIVAQKFNREDFYIIGEAVKSADRKSIIWCKWICPNPFIS